MKPHSSFRFDGSYTCIFGATVAAFCILGSTTADATKYREMVLHSFSGGSDGALPYGALIDVKGRLYSTTQDGGANNDGTVFSIDQGTGSEKVLYSFADTPDGGFPGVGLTIVKGALYGTTETGGAKNDGTVFSIDPNTGGERVVYSFCGQQNCADGGYPLAGLIDVNGTLYGTTGFGGTGSCPRGHYDPRCGTVFSIDRKTGSENVLYSFAGGTDGASPEGTLINVNGTLYGTTYSGSGSGFVGTVFSIDPNTGAEKVVYSFCTQQNCADGARPVAGLINVNGTLYGTTSTGGLGGIECCGTVFSVDPKTGAEKVLYSFTGSPDGVQPDASLIDVNGTLYGTTYFGGAAGCTNGCGTVFSIDPNTGAERIVYSFCTQQNCADGAYPAASLIDVNGTLYGTTVVGGTDNLGTVFVLRKKR